MSLLETGQIKKAAKLERKSNFTTFLCAPPKLRQCVHYARHGACYRHACNLFLVQVNHSHRDFAIRSFFPLTEDMLIRWLRTLLGLGMKFGYPNEGWTVETIEISNSAFVLT